MKPFLRFAASLALLAVAACGTRPALEAAPKAPTVPVAPSVSTSAASSDGDTVDRAMKKVVAFATEAEVRASLEPRPGEERADRTRVVVRKSATPEERAARDKCQAVREKIIAKNAKLPADKRFAALVKAFAKSNDENRACAELRDADIARSTSTSRDYRARLQMVLLAKGLSQAGLACKGASSASTSGLCTEEPAAVDLGDDAAWSCVAKHLGTEEKESLAIPGYTYGYTVDARLGTYEIVARGCIDGTTTELVLRGKIGASADDLFVYRRKVS